jgi:hypothetical protein
MNNALPEMSEDGVFPIFFIEPVHDVAASKKAGRAKFRNEERVRIMIPGDRNNVGVFPVEEKHRKRWPQQYAAFKENGKNVVEGTPLTEWPYIDRARVMELQSMHIHTVEQLANVPEGFVTNFGPGGADLVGHARATIASDPLGVEGVKAIKERDEFKVEVERKQTENDQLKQQIAALQQQLEATSSGVAEVNVPEVPQMPAVQDNPPAMPQMPGVTMPTDDE